MTVNTHDHLGAHRPSRTPAASSARGHRAWIWARRLLWPVCITGGVAIGLTGHEALGVAVIAAAPASASLATWRSYKRR
ncbi:hypothetical protein CG747_32425 [Streptomyces sp. CB02959]|uniref:hypothetical protein n=1 Tax=Streptomyces sp. CB02959 TaxID=2020330 RepID=UPI000C27177C|nr:hypothetical protein [Streptomyces sp. CB02959]PJN36641.1 hypothetical protein CG747_32425 [Streptomyces sp. CB02959]